MRDVFGVAAQWLDEGRSFALATLVELRDAATAPVGTTIAVDAGGHVVGTVQANRPTEQALQVRGQFTF